MRIGFHFSALWSWLHFLVFTVLPIAFRELLHWLYDYQFLAGTGLAVLAAWIWGRAVIKAARIAAKGQAASIAPPAPEAHLRPSAAPKVVPIPLAASGAPAIEPTVKKLVSVPKSPLAERLFALRELIRATLGRMPCSDDALSAERLADCRRIAEFALGDIPADAPRLQAHRFDVLRSELSALGAVRETDTCRNAWEALVRINMDAREIVAAEPAAPAAAIK